jgi:hypothetical protein
MPNKVGHSLELFFIDGTSDGMLTAEIFNWTGHVLLTPRIRLVDALKRPESKLTGVYILVGDREGSNLVHAYIGEAEDIGDRIRSHDTNKDWWTQAALITSAKNRLNKAHVKYLESRLVEEAKQAGRMNVENIKTPPRPSLSEADQANMEHFVDQVLTVLPAIGIDGFVKKTRPVGNAASSTPFNTHSKVVFELKSGEHSEHGRVHGRAYLEDGEFVVQEGSVGRSRWIGVEHSYQRLFDEVVESGVYVEDGGQRRFTKPYAFSSTSAAGAVLNGRVTAGPKDWVLESDPSKTYKQWEAEQLKME